MTKQLVSLSTNEVIFQGTKRQIVNYLIQNHSDSPWVSHNTHVDGVERDLVKLWCITIAMANQLGFDII